MPSRRDCTDMSQEWWTALRHSTCSSECYDFSDDDLEGQHQVIHMLNQDATSVVGSCVQQEGNHQYEWSTRRRMVNKLRKPVVVLQDSPAGSATRGSGHAQRSRKTCHDSNQQKTCCPQCQQSCRRLALQCHKQQKQISSQALRLGGQTAAVRAMEEALQSKDAALAMLQQALDDKTVALARMRAAQRLKPRQRTRSMTAMKSALGKESELATKVKLLESQVHQLKIEKTHSQERAHQLLDMLKNRKEGSPLRGSSGKEAEAVHNRLSKLQTFVREERKQRIATERELRQERKLSAALRQHIKDSTIKGSQALVVARSALACHRAGESRVENADTQIQALKEQCSTLMEEICDIQRLQDQLVHENVQLRRLATEKGEGTHGMGRHKKADLGDGAIGSHDVVKAPQPLSSASSAEWINAARKEWRSRVQNLHNSVGATHDGEGLEQSPGLSCVNVYNMQTTQEHGSLEDSPCSPDGHTRADNRERRNSSSKHCPVDSSREPATSIVRHTMSPASGAETAVVLCSDSLAHEEVGESTQLGMRVEHLINHHPEVGLFPSQSWRQTHIPDSEDVEQCQLDALHTQQPGKACRQNGAHEDCSYSTSPANVLWRKVPTVSPTQLSPTFWPRVERSRWRVQMPVPEGRYQGGVESPNESKAADLSADTDETRSSGSWQCDGLEAFNRLDAIITKGRQHASLSIGKSPAQSLVGPDATPGRCKKLADLRSQYGALKSKTTSRDSS